MVDDPGAVTLIASSETADRLDETFHYQLCQWDAQLALQW